MLVPNNSMHILPFPGPNQGGGNEAQLKCQGNNLVLNAGCGADNIHVSKGCGGNYNVNVNGQNFQFTPEQFARLQINGGRGDDTISIDKSVDMPVNVNGGRGDDTILNQANGANIKGGRGDDTIVNRSMGSTIKGGRGCDKIDSSGAFNQIGGGRGRDDINSTGSFNQINGGRGRDDINSLGNFNNVRGNRGRDQIQSFGNHNQVNGGRGRDDVFSYGQGNQVHGGRGCDKVTNHTPPTQTCQPTNPCQGPGSWNQLGQMLQNPAFMTGLLTGLLAGQGGGCHPAGNMLNTLAEGAFWNAQLHLGNNPWSFNPASAFRA